MRILYVDVDTLRADHTGPYGYQRAITPNLDAIAGDSVVLERCYASDTPCAPSRAALLSSGQFGITTGAIANFGPAAEIRMFDRTRYAPSFGGHLYRNGIYTASISCFPERHMAYWFLSNFREWLKPSLSNGDDEDAATVTAAARQWLQRNGRNDGWFLQVHFWDPHVDDPERRRIRGVAPRASSWPFCCVRPTCGRSTATSLERKLRRAAQCVVSRHVERPRPLVSSSPSPQDGRPGPLVAGPRPTFDRLIQPTPQIRHPSGPAALGRRHGLQNCALWPAWGQGSTPSSGAHGTASRSFDLSRRLSRVLSTGDLEFCRDPCVRGRGGT